MASKTLIIAGCVFAAAIQTACARTEALEEMPAGTEVTVITEDGSLVRGKIAKVAPESVVLTGEPPQRTTTIARTSITEVKRVTPATANSPATAARARALTIPANSTLDVTLGTSLASDTNHIEDPVRATLTSPVVIDEATAIPAGSIMLGSVTSAKDSGKVQGRAELGFRFDRLQIGSVTYDVDTEPLFYRAESTKKDDAVKIGIGAAAGAVVGAITGGKKGAAIGTAVGAGGGTAVVLATDGDEIRLPSGRQLHVVLNDPLTIRVR